MHSFETPEFQAAFAELLAWRRDVRSFRPEPPPEALVDELLQTVALAPSVGLSQPWRFLRLRSDDARAAVRANFERCNADALAGCDGADAALYARLKLSGLDEAPVQLAAFCDGAGVQGRGLGRRTMPEMLDHSVAMAVHTLWLSARARGLGLGWVSIIDPDRLRADLRTPDDWRLIAVLCLGWPHTATRTPELERLAWERRRPGRVHAVER